MNDTVQINMCTSTPKTKSETVSLDSLLKLHCELNTIFQITKTKRVRNKGVKFIYILDVCSILTTSPSPQKKEENIVTHSTECVYVFTIRFVRFSTLTLNLSHTQAQISFPFEVYRSTRCMWRVRPTIENFTTHTHSLSFRVRGLFVLALVCLHKAANSQHLL